MGSGKGARRVQGSGFLQKAGMLGEESIARKAFLSVFFVSVIFFVASQLLQFNEEALEWFGISLLLPMAITYKLLGRDSALVFAGCSIAYFIFTGVGGIPTLYLHMVFLSLALYFLWGERGALVSGCGNMATRVKWGLGVFLLMIMIVGITNLAMQAIMPSEGQPASGNIPTLPLYLLICSFTLGPVSEELFFRAVLVPRAGVVGSTLLFTLAHLLYGGMNGIVPVFFLGLVLALAYHHIRDPLPCIMAHFLFNLLSVSLILWVY